MKYSLPALASLLILTSCAGVRVHETQVASGATDPKAIYIRPFDVTGGVFSDEYYGPGEEPIRRSLAPHAWSLALKHELEKIAPTTILKPGEAAPTGWLVDGSLDVVDAGQSWHRGPGEVVKPFGVSRSQVMIHVRVSDVTGEYAAYDDKDSDKLGRRGNTLYEFDLKGGSNRAGAVGSIHAAGLGHSVPFDFKNAAERVQIALSADPHGYGERTSPHVR